MIRVLYVDDDPLLLDAGRLYIQKLSDFTVDIAESAAEAIIRLGQISYDAIISDYQMPVMDGLSFLRHLRENKNTIPFILFTGKGREEVVIEALNNGADYYLQKGGQPRAQFTELIHKVRLAIEKRDSEKELRRSHQQIKDIINHLPDPTFAINLNGEVIAWNRAQAALTGLSGDEIIGKGDGIYAKALYGDIRPMLVDAILNEDILISNYYRELSRDDDTITGETSWIQTPHGTRILWGKASPLYDENGTITGAIETVRDITSIKKTEQDLLNANQKLSDIIDFLPDPTFAIDTKGVVIAWNHAIEEMTGVIKNDIIGKGDYVYAIPFYGERRPILIDFLYKNWEEIRDSYDYVHENNGHLIAELYNQKMYNGKGAYLWGITAPLKDVRGNIVGAIESIRDITERKQIEAEILKRNEELAVAYEELSGSYEEITASMEEIRAQQEQTERSETRFQSLIEHLPDGIIIVQDEHIRYANPAAHEMLTYNPEGGLIGRHLTHIVDASSFPRFSFQLSGAENLRGSYIEEYFIRSDGRQIPVEVASFPCTDMKEGDRIVIFRDISEQKRSVDAIRLAHKKMEMLSGITRHDIRNHISTIASLMEFLTPDTPQEEFQPLIEKIDAGISMIKSDIEFSKDYEQLGSNIPCWFSLKELFTSAFSNRERQDLSWSYTEPDAEIYADPLIAKVLPNLIDNSIRHGERVTQIFILVESSPDALNIIYQDNGCGIPDDVKELIFQIGYGKHTGFGLFLIREILQITGITITENGTFGEGAQFVISVPKGRFRRGS
ncbi:PAS domain S-box protein [Methanospirillum hungatei]|uniref:PAS domain S-box protein n=1 Tax=Methanospirillum hungatei TaxID=2203 RepID=UPI0009D532AB|nr:PAS domain S-box protein [Methanospirillum hungatei]OQA59981.1 MAG: sensory histidine kinase AtoS [Euryarchaeota archaeon ADurb.Bin294]HOW04223.1 PAS domain S-box protein [Methanospirillum hungatei]